MKRCNQCSQRKGKPYLIITHYNDLRNRVLCTQCHKSYKKLESEHWTYHTVADNKKHAEEIQVTRALMRAVQ